MNRVKELSEKFTKDEIIIALWSLLDDIDTASDLAKDNNEMYRGLVEMTHKKRWNTGITSDGYNLYLRGKKIGL